MNCDMDFYAFSLLFRRQNLAIPGYRIRIVLIQLVPTKLTCLIQPPNLKLKLGCPEKAKQKFLLFACSFTEFARFDYNV